MRLVVGATIGSQTIDAIVVIRIQVVVIGIETVVVVVRWIQIVIVVIVDGIHWIYSNRYLRRYFWRYSWFDLIGARVYSLLRWQSQIIKSIIGVSGQSVEGPLSDKLNARVTELDISETFGSFSGLLEDW